MSKPKSKPQLSLDAAHLSDQAAGIPHDDWSRFFFEQIHCSFNDADFTDLCEQGDRYPISPALPACLTILQYMFRVSDRAAVENTVMRRDWRIALGRTDDWAGFDPSVLCNFRKRLVRHGRDRERLRPPGGGLSRRPRERGLVCQGSWPSPEQRL